MFSRIPRYTSQQDAPCAECNCPADFEWLPCTDVCRQQERIDRLAPAPLRASPLRASPLRASPLARQAAYPPLPDSDDEGFKVSERNEHTQAQAQAQDPFYEDREPDYDLFMDNAYWTILDPCWPQYEHEIGYLAKFPHLVDEAQFIHALLFRRGMTRDELVRVITELEPEGLFMRSYSAVTWHLKMMERAGIIYAQ